MCHKAYALDHLGFSRELRPILVDALTRNDAVDVVAFVDGHIGELTYPWDSEPLSPEWRQSEEVGDVHAVGDLALTKYYDADEDFGLQELWSQVDDRLPEDRKKLLLGESLGPPENVFDPGKMGSFFQSPSRVVEAHRTLQSSSISELVPFVAQLQTVTERGLGLYVTF